MAILQRSPALRVRREPVETTAERLRTFSKRMERRYECSSDFMAAAVAAGDMHSTAEIARWLSDYRTLQRLTESDAEGSTSTTPTG